MLIPRITMLFLGLAVALHCQAQISYQLITRSFSNGYAEGSRPAVSGDGRFVVFYSFSHRLVLGVPDVPTGSAQWYLHDRQSGQVELLTRDGSGAVSIPIGGPSEQVDAAGVSDDGRIVVFDTSARLLPEDTNNNIDVYLRDRSAGTLHYLGGTPTAPLGITGRPMISPDGRVVVFLCNLEPLDTGNFTPQILWMDRLSGEKRFIVRRLDGTPLREAPFLSDLAKSGRRVVFHSKDDGLVAGDTNGKVDVFSYDVDTDSITRISLDHAGRQINISGFEQVAGQSGRLSENGRLLVFESDALGVTPEVVGGGGTPRVYSRDLLSGETTLLCRYGDSLVGAGLYVNQFGCREPDVSGDGQLVVFRSRSTEMIDGPGSPQVYEANLQTKRLRLLSKDSSGQPCDEFCGPAVNDSLGDGFGYSPRISDDGAHVVFSGVASNLVPVNDTLTRVQIYARTEPRLAPIVARAAPLSPWMYGVLLVLLGWIGMRAFGAGTALVSRDRLDQDE